MMAREVPHSSRNQGKYQLSLSVSVRGQEIYLSSPVTGHCTAITAAIHQTVRQTVQQTRDVFETKNIPVYFFKILQGL